MGKIMGVNKARPALGGLVDDVVAGKGPVVITKRTGEAAVLIGYQDFVTLKALADGKAKERLQKALKALRRVVRARRLPKELVEEAIRATRALR